MDFNDKNMPAVGIIVPSRMSKYHFEGDVRSMNADQLTDFIESVGTG